ncbi:MAG: c-type cytochrome [Acidimicrobiales bacterium]
MPVAVLMMVAGSCALAACVAEPPEVTLDDDELVEGREIYARNCASCHGSAGDGGVGRKLSGGAVVEAYPNIKDQIDIIANGKGAMQPYAGRLTGQQMQAVARYTREVL